MVKRGGAGKRIGKVEMVVNRLWAWDCCTVPRVLSALIALLLSL